MRRPPRTAWQSLSRPGHLLSAWPWRAAAYLLSGAVTGAVLLVGLVSALAAGLALAVVLVGLPLLLLTALAGLPVARWERWRLRLVDRAPAADSHRPPLVSGLRPWLLTRLRERVTWRELGHAVLLATVLWPLDALAVTAALGCPLAVVATPSLLAWGGGEAKVLKLWTITGWPAASGVALLGLLLLALGGYALGVAAGARAALARLLLGDGPTDQVVELTRSRARLVAAFEAERRRIERDLHDGAQQRLVALTMTLGLARLDAPPDGPLAAQLAKAHEEAGLVLAELRELIHGIHPRVLADYGLPAAVGDAADRSAVPVDVRLSLPGRLPPSVETAAYFAVCEALANVGKHSGAARAEVTGGHGDGRLVLEVSDDGVGGAEPGSGSGLTGLADRVSVLDGRLTLSSPRGGPTLLRVEIPCEPTAHSG
ncbi:sensor domain-containing protein [Streptomyces sp. NPDC003717]|uniref:sensor histidine kinase n=1 Tax=Streptomyces sp. NPDC003717 TaxID=3154276 RepID=UPI0033A98288